MTSLLPASAQWWEASIVSLYCLVCSIVLSLCFHYTFSAILAWNMYQKRIPGTSHTKWVSTEWDMTVTTKTFWSDTQEKATVFMRDVGHDL